MTAADAQIALTAQAASRQTPPDPVDGWRGAAPVAAAIRRALKDLQRGRIDLLEARLEGLLAGLAPATPGEADLRGATEPDADDPRVVPSESEEPSLPYNMRPMRPDDAAAVEERPASRRREAESA